MKRAVLLFIFFSTVACIGKDHKGIQVQAYEPNWSSLRKHDTPDWFDGLKFGMYFHWGWQTAQLASSNNDLPQLEALEQWTGEKFDAEAWAELYAKSGARFAGPVAEHCDGFAFWDSKLTQWDSVDKGPRRDVVAEMEKAIRG